METAPLTAAHAHARNASHSQSAAAAEEHKHAADAFAAAASDVQDSEALRILQLLEEHHRQLARIIESPRSSSKTAAVDESKSTAFPATSPIPLDTAATAMEPSSSAAVSQQPGQTTPAALQRKPPREISTSIASNLATARGINRNQQRRNPTAPQPQSQNAKETAAGVFNAEADSDADPRSAVGHANAHKNTQLPAEPSKEAQKGKSERSASGDMQSPPGSPQEEPFSKFYATFEGLLSKLSAPLAFAGLPLGPEDAAPPANDSSAANSPATHRSDQPPPGTDIEKLFSKAALRAIRAEGDGAVPGRVGGAGVQDSFYVVPVGTKTSSHAEQSLRQQLDGPQHRRQASAADEFVDARETMPPGSPTKSRHKSPEGTRKVANKKTDEELALENETLRQLSDTLSKRLYMWETSAQNQSEALQASRMLRGGPASTGNIPPLPAGTEPHPASQQDTASAVKDMEAQLAAAQRDMEKVGRENDKLRAVVARYRERWEKLKEGARVRREGTSGGAGTPGKT